MKNPFRDNSLSSRADMQRLASEMLHALKPYYSEGKALMHLGETATHHSVKIADMEAFARPLFGLVPLTQSGFDCNELWEIYRTGIINGTNPSHEEYWGNVTGGQMIVEMTTLGFALLMVPEKVWEPLSSKERTTFSSWLYQINLCPVGLNNWAFFTVIVNLGLQHVGEPFEQSKIEEAYENIDRCYIGNGWYTDGPGVPAMDYYIPFAMHFYGLFCARFLETQDKRRSDIFKERAALFAKDFIHWFAQDGSAVPYGRSLSYRFAMSAFWSAMVFAGVETFSWGIIKGLILRNLRWWMKKPIFSDNGYLTIGYTYPNLKVSEYYMAPGSPYWAMKVFLPLALDESHPFWQAKEEALPPLPELNCQKEPMLIACHEQDRDHTFFLTSGQFSGFVPDFIPAKYEKFSYSSVFGFSVPSAEYDLDQGAFDSTLAFCEHDRLFRTRLKCEETIVTPSHIFSRWLPYSDVEVKTWLIPCTPWHVRVHIIQSGRKLEAAEGGFAINSLFEEEELLQIQSRNRSSVETPNGLSQIFNLYGERNGVCIDVRPNTNLIHPKTLLPMLICDIEVGRTILACAVLGQPKSKNPYSDKVPRLEIKDNRIIVNGNFIDYFCSSF